MIHPSNSAVPDEGGRGNILGCLAQAQSSSANRNLASVCDQTLSCALVVLVYTRDSGVGRPRIQ
ncbi:inositol polyphosphate phosphatase [Moniliophthora roreri]|nr:inositol polyphosphate phosphatase [Moniliophthora roreri]